MIEDGVYIIKQEFFQLFEEKNIKKKLKRILSYEEQNPNKLEQKITYIKNELINEINK